MPPLRKSVLITGCSPGGIGHALAKEYHSKGLFVIATARNESVLVELRTLGLASLQLDVTDSGSIRRARDEVEKLTGGKLDILVNNAGKSYTVPATDVTEDGVRSLFETNVFSIMNMVPNFVHLLIAAEGKIVNIGSVAGITPIPFGSVYNASKAALHAYGDTLRVELKPFNVQVITVITGGVKSNISTHNQDILPGSLYYPMNDEYVLRRKGFSQRAGTAMSTETYAASVVTQTLQTYPRPWIWEGGKSSLVWVVSLFFPRSIVDWYMTHSFGLDILAGRIAQSKKTT